MARKYYVTDRQWSNLPLDLLESIMKRLHYIDHLRLRAVCKNWHSMFKVSPSKQLPWLVILHKHSWDSFKLYDPTSNRSFLIDLKPSFLQTENSLVSIHTCKYSWLLLSQTLNYSIFFFLYSPFNTNLDKVIKLPKLTSCGLVDVASFSSSPPNSSNCLVFALKSLYASVDISTYRLGDDAWNTRKFLLPSPLTCPIVYNFIYHVEYLDGIFYCSSRNGMLGIYNVVEENYCLHEVKKLRYSTNSYMVKTEKGEILLIDIVNRRCINKIYRLDFTEMAWEESDGLDLQECYDPWIMGFKIDSRKIDKNDCKKIWIEPPY